jgi:hypothetical protein
MSEHEHSLIGQLGLDGFARAAAPYKIRSRSRSRSRTLVHEMHG